MQLKQVDIILKSLYLKPQIVHFNELLVSAPTPSVRGHSGRGLHSARAGEFIPRRLEGIKFNIVKLHSHCKWDTTDQGTQKSLIY